MEAHIVSFPYALAVALTYCGCTATSTNLPVHTRQVEWRQPMHVPGVDVRPHTDKRPDNVAMAVGSCPVPVPGYINFTL